MSVTRIPPPPKDLDSFLGRKWLETITRQAVDITALTDISFLVLTEDSALPNARTLTSGTDVSITDAGPGNDATLTLTDTTVTPGSYNTVVVDQKGRVTSGSSTSYASLNTANTFTADQSVPDEVYGVAWNGSLEVPTKNALYDKIETIGSSGSDGDARRLIHLGY